MYAKAVGGGSGGNGAVFAINVDGTGIRTLYSFTTVNPNTGTNRDGAYPYGLILSGNTLYGTTEQGGSGGNGTVFVVNTNGTSFRVLHSFTPTGYNYTLYQ